MTNNDTRLCFGNGLSGSIVIVLVQIGKRRQIRLKRLHLCQIILRHFTLKDKAYVIYKQKGRCVSLKSYGITF